MSVSSATSRRSALCLGHPGHEIKVLVWAARHRPVVTIFTDGSGPDRPSRLESTRKILEAIGCEPAPLFGGLPDREIYQLMRQGPQPFVSMAERLHSEWREQQIDTVAGDAMEGFNPTHDVCRMIINAVVEKLRRGQRAVKNLCFPLDGLELELPQVNADRVLVILDDKKFAWKQEVVKNSYPEMAGEVERVIAKYGEEPFRREVLTPAPQGAAGMFWHRTQPPYYETYGASQIEKGHYQELITYREQLLPIAEGLWNWACEENEAATPCVC